MISVVFGGIEIARRLVAEQNLRIVDQRARDRRALLLAAGELAGIHAALVREPDQVEHARNLTHDVAGVRAGDLQRERHVLPDGLVGEQFEVLKDDAEVAAQCRNAAAAQAVDADAVDGDVTGGRDHLAIQQAKQTGFSGSGMADEEDEVALSDFEIDVVEGAHSVRIYE